MFNNVEFLIQINLAKCKLSNTNELSQEQGPIISQKDQKNELHHYILDKNPLLKILVLIYFFCFPTHSLRVKNTPSYLLGLLPNQHLLSFLLITAVFLDKTLSPISMTHCGTSRTGATASAGFLGRGMTDIWGWVILLWGQGCFAHCRVFSSILGLYQPDARGNLPPTVATKNAPRNC